MKREILFGLLWLSCLSVPAVAMRVRYTFSVRLNNRSYQSA